jgi:DNA-binding transcriptional LysR family regulator
MHLKEVDANLLVILDALLVDASVTRAAERLGRSASAISHALAKLREIFDDALFVRAGQRLVPTAKALELAPTVHVILAGMESLLRANKPFDPTLAERDFVIAAPEAGELVLLQPLRTHLQARAPLVRVGWMAGGGEDSIAALRNSHCHFAIDVQSTAIPAADVRAVKLFDDRLVVLGRPEHPLRRGKVGAAALAAANHVAVNALPSFALLERHLAEAGHLCMAPEMVSSVLVGLLLVSNSDALLSVPASLAEILEPQFPLARIGRPLLACFPVRLLWHSSYDRDECHQWVRGEIVRLAAAREHAA